MRWLNGNISMPRFKRPRWPLFAVLFCCFAGAILGDNAAESLLLAHCDTRLIPYMFLVNAVFLFMSSTVLMSLIDKVSRGVLFMAMTFGHGAMLLLIKTALMFHAPVLYPFLFSYAYVSKILLFLIFWSPRRRPCRPAKGKRRISLYRGGRDFGGDLRFLYRALAHESDLRRQSSARVGIHSLCTRRAVFYGARVLLERRLRPLPTNLSIGAEV